MQKQQSELKKEYKILKSKYNLPSFEYFDSEFDIGKIEAEKIKSLPKELLRCVVSKIVIFLNYFEPVLGPPQTVHSAIEISNLSDSDKKGVFKLFKKLAHLYHLGVAAELGTENEMIGFINNVLGSWKELKNETKNYLVKIGDTYTKEKVEKIDRYIS